MTLMRIFIVLEIWIQVFFQTSSKTTSWFLHLQEFRAEGVNLGSRNIQKIRDTDPERTSTTLMHELGHAHGYMGDEYRTDDDRDVSQFADDNVNTSTQSDVSLLKWNHHISDQLNVLGRDIEVCYNVGDGRIYDLDTGEYVPGTNLWLSCKYLGFFNR